MFTFGPLFCFLKIFFQNCIFVQKKQNRRCKAGTFPFENKNFEAIEYSNLGQDQNFTCELQKDTFQSCENKNVSWVKRSMSQSRYHYPLFFATSSPVVGSRTIVEEKTRFCRFPTFCDTQKNVFLGKI